MARRKWELVEEGKAMVRSDFYPVTGYERNTPVIVDVYRKRRRNGTYKYKNVTR